MFLIIDSYGTRQRAWTRRGALSWLACASPDACIVDLFGRIVARRAQHRIY